ncbi:MAG: DMT family transporter [Holosporales bacterium]|jgi:S-adenosylmethionine uptake transporter|nr:DMT family transporter [Holosporales bacterium]
MPFSRETLRGVLWTLIGFALYVFSDAFIKHITQLYPIAQVTFLRALMRLLPLFLISLVRHGGNDLKTRYPKRHAIRLGANLMSTYTVIYVMSREPLVTVYVIYYTMPLFIVLFGRFLLGEKVNYWQWSAVLVGFIGVIVAIRPSSMTITPISLIIILIGVVSAALNKTFMRQLAQTESSFTIVIYPNIAMIVVLTPFVLTSWTPLSWAHWGDFLLMGGIVAFAQYAVTHALHFAPLAVLAPLDYTTFVWGAFFDITLWGIVPESCVLMGAAIVIGSNLLILGAKSKVSPLSKS